MRKFVVPIVALAGIALLSPHADAANLIIKSRATAANHPVSLPVQVNNVGGTGQLWGIDFAVTYTTLTAATDPGTGASFTPQAVTGSTETPVVVSGAPSVGTVVANPTLYVGYVRGTVGMPVTAGTGAPTNGIGLLRLAVPTGTALKTLVTLTSAAYNVANDGTGSTTISRAGATGATSDVAAGAAVNAEAITVLDFYPGTTAPAGSQPDLRTPLHSVYVCGGPGDVTGDGNINAGDLTLVKTVLVGVNPAAWTPGARIAGDVAPPNGYTSTNIPGTAGAGYGDGKVNAGDLTLMKARAVGAAGASFPVNE